MEAEDPTALCELREARELLVLAGVGRAIRGGRVTTWAEALEEEPPRVMTCWERVLDDLPRTIARLELDDDPWRVITRRAVELEEDPRIAVSYLLCPAWYCARIWALAAPIRAAIAAGLPRLPPTLCAGCSLELEEEDELELLAAVAVNVQFVLLPESAQFMLMQSMAVELML